MVIFGFNPTSDCLCPTERIIDADIIKHNSTEIVLTDTGISISSPISVEGQTIQSFVAGDNITFSGDSPITISSSGGGGGANINLSNLVDGEVSVSAGLTPSLTETYNLGESNLQWLIVHARSFMSFSGGQFGAIFLNADSDGQVKIKSSNTTPLKLEGASAVALQIINVEDPTTAQGAATKNYVDTHFIAGTGITFDGTGPVTISSTGGGGGATTALDNLASVAINSDLIFGVGQAGIIQTAFDGSASTALNISTGIAGSFTGGISFKSGVAGFASGDAHFGSGEAGSGYSGDVFIESDQAGGHTKPSGNIHIQTAQTTDIQGFIDFYSASVKLKNRTPLRFMDDDNSNYVGFIPALTISSDVTWTLPTTDGTSGQVLSTNGSSILSWTTMANTNLSNITGVAIPSGVDLIPQTDADNDLGSPTNRFEFAYIADSILLQYDTLKIGDTAGFQTTFSNADIGVVGTFFGSSSELFFGTQDSTTGTSTTVDIGTGKVTGAFNSGDINLKTGDSTGATRGNIKLNAPNIEITGHTRSLGSAPAVSACGTSPSVSGTDTTGLITTGTGVFTSCLITFNVAYATAPHCFVNDQTTTLLLKAFPTTTTLTISGATITASDQIDYFCIAN
jgi:hypothetical protein